MHFQTMREFLVLAETLNFLSAAEQLYISQATLSKHIKELETELGAPLFKRSTRKVVLTELGMRMMPYARKAVELEAAFHSEVEAYRERMNNLLTIGCVNRLDAIDLALMTLSFQKLHPEIRITIVTDESVELLSMLNDDLCDFIIVREETDPPRDSLDRLLLCEDSLYAFLPKNHPLAGDDHVSLPQLRDESFLMGADGSLSYNLGRRACYEAGFQPNIIYRGGRAQTFHYLTHGLGIGLMFGNPMGVPESEQNVVKLPLEPQIYANINLVYKNASLSEAGKIFRDFASHYQF